MGRTCKVHTERSWAASQPGTRIWTSLHRGHSVKHYTTMLSKHKHLYKAAKSTTGFCLCNYICNNVRSDSSCSREEGLENPSAWLCCQYTEPRSVRPLVSCWTKGWNPISLTLLTQPALNDTKKILIRSLYFVYVVCTALQIVSYHFCLTLFPLKVMLITSVLPLLQCWRRGGGFRCFLLRDLTLLGNDRGGSNINFLWENVH